MTRTVTETVFLNTNEQLVIAVTTSDGLSFAYPVATHTQTVKEFETALGVARTAAYERRVWLNKRKSLTVDEINQLLTVAPVEG